VTFKNLPDMTPDERARLQERLTERRDALLQWRDRIRSLQAFSPQPDEAYDVGFYSFSGIGMRIGRGVLSKKESEAFTAEMRAAGIERHKTFARLALAIVNAQLAEAEIVLEQLSAG
jgi:hypothetical protein